MKYIISESQYRLLKEGKIQIFQHLLHNVLNNIISDCEYINLDPFKISFQTCNEVDGISKIEINNFEWQVNTEYLILTVDVYLDSIWRYEPEELLYDMAKRMSNLLGTKVKINLDSVHLIKEPNW